MTLTRSDLGKIEGMLETQEEKYEKKIDEFKNEFYERIDPILKEVTATREERPLIENRLEKLEKIHPKGKHTFSS